MESSVAGKLQAGGAASDRGPISYAQSLAPILAQQTRKLLKINKKRIQEFSNGTRKH